MARHLFKDSLFRIALSAMCETKEDEWIAAGLASRKTRRVFCEKWLSEVHEVAGAQNRILANREKLGGAVFGVARYMVLVTPPPDQRDLPQVFRQPGITGAMQTHILDIAERDEVIRSMLACIHPAISLEDPSGVLAACRCACRIEEIQLNVFNRVRIALGDYNPDSEKDWLHPFVAAMCVWQEDQYRKLIGLPCVLAKDKVKGLLEGLRYSTFANFVRNGEKYPNLAWEKYYDRRPNAP